MREVINIYYADHPLNKTEIAGGLLSFCLEHFPGSFLDIKQKRIPWLYPIQDRHGHFSSKLIDYISIYKKHFIRVGTTQYGHEHNAFLHPELPSPNALNAVLVLALREATGSTPYILKRHPWFKSGIRIIAPDQLTKHLSQKLAILACQTT